MDKWTLPSNASDALKHLVAVESGSIPAPSSSNTSASTVTAHVSSVIPLPPTSLNKQSNEKPAPLYAGKYCCVVGCSNNQGRDIARGISFHLFPVNTQRRQLWIQAVKRRKANKPSELWTPAKNTVICSEHFFGGRKSDIEGSPAYVPSIFPTHHVRPKTKEDDARFKRREKFQRIRDKATDNVKSSDCYAPTCTSPGVQAAQVIEENRRLYQQSTSLYEPALPEEENDKEYLDENENAPLKISLSYATQVNMPTTENNKFVFEVDISSATEKKTQASIPSEKNIRHKINRVTQTYHNEACLPFEMFTDKQFVSFCGVSRQIAAFLGMRAGSRVKDGRIIKKQEKIYLVLVKFKLNVPFAVLGGFFGISESLAKSVFHETLDAIYEGVKNCVVWFDKETIKTRMPLAFKVHFPDTRAIIDCTEIECEIPPQLRQQVLMFSNYKSRHTYKLLVAVAPSGEFMFVSKGYGGRTTDTHITVDSGFLDLIEEGDVILSDKGFPSIESQLSEKGGILVMPPFKRGNRQFSAKENKDGYQCASVRVHVERAIRRLKVFRIMKFIPQKMIPYMDRISIVIAFMCNCLPDLIADEENDDDDDDIINRTGSLTI